MEIIVTSLVEKYLATHPISTSTTTTLPTKTPHPKHNYKEFQFTELIEMMHARMLEQVVLRETYLKLYESLNKVADLEAKCIFDVLRESSSAHIQTEPSTFTKHQNQDKQRQHSGNEADTRNKDKDVAMDDVAETEQGDYSMGENVGESHEEK
ncbi:hypothetical protein Tco_0095382 [Tanacetum coccineum]